MNVLLKKEPVNRVNVALKKFNESFNIIVLNATAKTAENAANSLKCDLGAIVKSLVFRAENDFLICLIAGDKRCSLNKLKKILKKKMFQWQTLTK